MHGGADQPIDLLVDCSSHPDLCQLTFLSRGRHPLLDHDVLAGWLAPFMRGSSQRDAVRVEGPGLGLTLVQQLVTAWGGTLDLQQHHDHNDPTLTITRVTVTVSLSSVEVPAGSPVDAETDQA